MAKADNMLAILWLLRAKQRMTGAQIAAALEISERTVYRYIDSLCASGVPIIADIGPEGGYRLAEAFKGAPLFFEAGELKALFHTAQFAREAGYPYSGALESAIAKVGRNLSPSQVSYVARHTAAFRAIPSGRGGPVAAWLEPLELAVAESVTVRMGYQKPENTEPEVRMVDPYGLIYYAGLWQLIAWCHARQALRHFRVDRIRSLERTDQTFVRPPDFDLDQHYSEAWLLEQVQTGPFTEVRLTGAPAALAALADHWYLRHCLVSRSATELHLRMDPRGFADLPAVLLPYGTSVRVLEPHQLKQGLIDLADNLIKHHSNA